MPHTSEEVSRVECSRMTLAKRLQNTVVRENKLKVSEGIDKIPEYQRLEAELRRLSKKLHKQRLLRRRKQFAIRVREARLKAIPKEIKKIGIALKSVEDELLTLETTEAGITERMTAIHKSVTAHLRQDGKLMKVPRLPTSA